MTAPSRRLSSIQSHTPHRPDPIRRRPRRIVRGARRHAEKICLQRDLINDPFLGSVIQSAPLRDGRSAVGDTGHAVEAIGAGGTAGAIAERRSTMVGDDAGTEGYRQTELSAMAAVTTGTAAALSGAA